MYLKFEKILPIEFKSNPGKSRNYHDLSIKLCDGLKDYIFVH
jgi:hypothetical protein